jgi:hypothetical protein
MATNKHQVRKANPNDLTLIPNLDRNIFEEGGK